MAGFLTTIGTALGGFMSGYDTSRENARKDEARQLQMQHLRMQQQQEQAERKAKTAAALAAFGLQGQLGGLSGAQTPDLTGGSGGGQLPPSPMGGFGGGDQAAMPPRTQPGQSMGGGLGAGGALTQRLTALGLSPDVAGGAVDYMRRNESGLRPDARNPTSGALGVAQWLGPRKQALESQYGPSPSLDQEGDFMVQELKGPESGTLAALRKASTSGGGAKAGYDIWGKSYERPGGAALAKAGVGGGGQAQPQAQAPQQTVPPAPPAYDPASVFRLVQKNSPGLSPEEQVMAVELVGQQLGPQYKQAFDRWKGMADIQLRQSGQAETGRHNVVEEGMGQQRIAGEAGARVETGRHNIATEGLGKGQLAETERSHKAAEAGRDKAFTAKIDKQNQTTQLATTQMRTLADRARRLYEAVRQNPSLVGVRGFAQRMGGGIKEQLGMGGEDPAVADFKAQVQLLQAQLQKPLLGARYFSGKAQETMAALVPALARLDNPTAVEASLRNLAETLEGTAEATDAATRGVMTDLSHMSDDELRQGLGIQSEGRE